MSSMEPTSKKPAVITALPDRAVERLTAQASRLRTSTRTISPVSTRLNRLPARAVLSYRLDASGRHGVSTLAQERLLSLSWRVAFVIHNLAAGGTYTSCSARWFGRSPRVGGQSDRGGTGQAMRVCSADEQTSITSAMGLAPRCLARRRPQTMRREQGLSGWVRGCYVASSILSAFLVFQVQPIVARKILPWFGGTPAVWSSVMLFFQATLTAGYAYSHWLVARQRRPGQRHVHLAVLGVSVGLVLVLGLVWPSPITPGTALKPAGVEWPVPSIIGILALSVGLPYFTLAANAPLMQAWYQQDTPGRRRIGCIRCPMLVHCWRC